MNYRTLYTYNPRVCVSDKDTLICTTHFECKYLLSPSRSLRYQDLADMLMVLNCNNPLPLPALFNALWLHQCSQLNNIAFTMHIMSQRFIYSKYLSFCLLSDFQLLTIRNAEAKRVVNNGHREFPVVKETCVARLPLGWMSCLLGAFMKRMLFVCESIDFDEK